MSMEKFSSMLWIFLNFNIIAFFLRTRSLNEDYVLLTPNQIKLHVEILVLINAKTLFIKFFAFISYLFRKCCSEGFHKTLLKSKENICDKVLLKKSQVSI